MSENCCRTTNEGTSFCVTTPSEKEVSCGCASQPASRQIISASAQAKTGIWPKIRGGVMFGVACLTSPCCTPLIVPLGLALIAGTPVAAWAWHYIGWIYGGLTLVSVLSLVLGWRWWGQETTSSLASPKKPVLELIPEVNRLEKQQAPVEVLPR